MAQIFNQLAKNKQAIVDAVVKVIQAVPDEHDYARDTQRLEAEVDDLSAKKDRLLELSIAGAITVEEFKRRNDSFNEQVKSLESQMQILQAEEEKSRCSKTRLSEIKSAVEQALSFSNGIDSSLVTTILDHIVVKKESTKENIYLDIHLKFGGLWEVAFQREKSSFLGIRLRNITPKALTKMILFPSGLSD